MNVKQVLSMMYSESYFCIFDDDQTTIVFAGKVYDYLKSGTPYDDWAVIDIEPCHTKDFGKDHTIIAPLGDHSMIMINCYNAKEDI
ncbi:MAG: hypothetical protein K2O54_00755 [Prevotella sp.]|nr:hypothetical protein [Prevotella sp.]